MNDQNQISDLLLLFCLLFRRMQAPRYMGGVQKLQDPNLQKHQGAIGKVEENGTVARLALGSTKLEGQIVRTGQMINGGKGMEEGGGPAKATRLGSDNAGQGYASDEVKVLFLILVDLCKRTGQLQHPLPPPQVGAMQVTICPHYIDGNYTVLPEVVEASLGPHM